MKNVDHVAEVKYEDLVQEEYTFDEIADMFGTSRGRVYYNVNKFRIPSRRVRGKIFITKDNVFYLMRCINEYIDDSVFHKKSHLYPSRRRVGHYRDHYRAREVTFILKISEDELAKLVTNRTLDFVLFSKNGQKRGGFSIEQVRKYAKKIGKI